MCCMVSRPPFAENNMGPTGAQALAPALVKSPLVTVLDVSANRLGVDGARALAAVLFVRAHGLAIDRARPKLTSCACVLRASITERARAWSNSFSDVRTGARSCSRGACAGCAPAAAAFDLALSRASCVVLEAPVNDIGSKGARLLAETIAHSRLVKLAIDNNHIDETGFVALEPVLAQSQLRKVLVQGNFDAEAMKRVSEHPAVLWRCAVDAAGDVWHESIHAAFPYEIRQLIFTLLVIARSPRDATRVRSLGLCRARQTGLHALFRALARLNYFTVAPVVRKARDACACQ